MIELKINRDLTVVLKGVPYDDLRSIVVAASIHHYESEKEIAAHTPDAEEGWLKEVQLNNIAAEKVWANQIRTTIDQIHKLIDEGIKKLNSNPFIWSEQNGEFSCHYNSSRGLVNLGNINYNNGYHCTVFDGMIDDIITKTTVLPTEALAKEWVESVGHKQLCNTCNTLHEEMAFCTNCKTCLYKHSKSLNDHKYPLFECSNCKKVNFWD